MVNFFKGTKDRASFFLSPRSGHHTKSRMIHKSVLLWFTYILYFCKVRQECVLWKYLFVGNTLINSYQLNSILPKIYNEFSFYTIIKAFI